MVPSASVGSDGRIVVVVLAAGEGSRFDGPTHKLLAPVGGSTVVGLAVAAAIEAGIGPVVVVGGAVDLTGAVPDTCELVVNDDWFLGQATSLAVGIDSAAGLGATAVVVGLGDQPGVPSDAWRRVADAVGGPIVTATFGGQRRPPVRLDAEVWPLLPRSGDEGARALMSRRPELVHEVACPGDPADIDRVADLERWT